MPTRAPTLVIDLSHQHFSADKARTLLRRLRDLNLSTGPIAVREDLTACLGGCSSLDAPAESGVRYRVRTSEAGENLGEVLMELTWTAAGLELTLTGPGMSATAGRIAPPGTGAGSTIAKLCVPVTCDRKGRACVPEIGARISPDSTDERLLEHFLRRAVRALLQ
jgi:hypothetical protein